MEYIALYFKELISLANEMSPYLLFGFFFAGLLKVFFPQRMLTRYMGSSTASSAFFASLLGVPMPLCSCGVLPTGISLFKNGASKGATTSFLISTPQTGIDSILVTYSMLGLPFAIIRPLAALLTGFLGGILTNRFVPATENQRPAGYVSGGKEDPRTIGFMLKYAFVDFLQDISKWLIIGLLLAAMISVLIPDDFFASSYTYPFVGMIFVLLASVPMYICATASVPLAAVLLAKGLAPGAVFVLLMAGPATNAATITVLFKTIGKIATTIYLATIVVGALLTGFILNFLPPEWFHTAHLHHGHDHGTVLPHWLGVGSSVILGLLIVNALYKKHQSQKIESMNPDSSINPSSVLIKVEGMECNHCKRSVETNLLKVINIQEVTADINSGTVHIKGADVDLIAVKTMVEDLGYSFKGKV